MNLLDEYEIARTAAVLFDTSDRGKIEVAGPDACSFLHNLSTNDVKQLAINSGCEAFFTTGQAKIVGYGVIYRTGTDEYWLDTDPDTAPRLVEHLNHFHITERLEIIDRTSEFAQFHIAGPKAEALLQTLAAGVSGMAQLQSIEAAIAGITCRIRRHDVMGLTGFDILCAAESSDALRNALQPNGSPHDSPTLYQLLRIEAGTPQYGIDIDDTNLPQEVGRSDATVSFTKGCYIGQETIARIRTYGHVNRTLCGLRLAENRSVPAGSLVFHGGKEVGRVTSSIVSPQVRTGIALAYLRRGSSDPGTTVVVAADGASIPAEVVELPFVNYRNT